LHKTLIQLRQSTSQLRQRFHFLDKYLTGHIFMYISGHELVFTL